MKKILSIFLFLIYFNNSFTYTNKDYNLFLDEKKLITIEIIHWLN